MESGEDPLGQQRPHSARMYDFYLGGRTNYPSDRRAAAKALTAYPNAMIASRLNRAFMHRATRYAAETAGIRQFLDIGTGIPTQPNLHQVAQMYRPDARVVYVDNDPIVLNFARALLTGTAQGRTDYIEADVREPETILERVRRTLDFSEPVAVSLVALLHFVVDAEESYGIVRSLLGPLAPGSLLALSHITGEHDAGEHGGAAGGEGVVEEGMAAVARVYEKAGMPLRLASRDEVGRFFDGLDPVEPFLVPSCDWRPDLALDTDLPTLPGMISPAETGVWVGVAHKRD
ncbi:SAM-dependent methyltransferase [Streptomyces cacaoi]|uniref:SAM-dependent methyltransferase n=1 Tax=Streptomyces cacaoi TaxID=1898 RepID=UPI00260319D7|nr:SAM-dependent methyltransferase [Streptomyces cacaoi]